MTPMSRRSLVVGSSSLLIAGAGAHSPAHALFENPQITLDHPTFTMNGPLSVTLQWPKLAASLSYGVLTSVAVKVVERVLFGSGGQDIDMAALMRAFVSEVRVVVKQQLAANDRERLEARSKGLQDLFRYYLNAPDAQLLTFLFRDMALGVRESERIGVYGIASYGVLGSLLLAVLQEKYLVTRADGDQKNIVVAARQLVDGVPAFSTALRVETEKRFSPLTAIGMGPGYYMDGTTPIHVQAFDHPKAVAQRAEYIDSVYAKARRELLDGLDDTRDIWIAIAKKYAEHAIHKTPVRPL